MQLTKFDRWLKERFIYETHIFTLRVPDSGLPKCVKVGPADPSKGGDFKYHLVVPDVRKLDDVIEVLRHNQIMYSTHVIEGNHWYSKFLAPRGNSFTWLWIMRLCTYATIASAGFWGFKLLQNPKIVSLVKGAVAEIQKGL
ncbi:MAG: hypothetical protein ACPG32_06545 [Akkermansiaceae bacterium]